MQVMYLGRAPRTKESLPDFLKWCRVTRHPLVFRGLTGSQREWGVTKIIVRTDDVSSASSEIKNIKKVGLDMPSHSGKGQAIAIADNIRT